MFIDDITIKVKAGRGGDGVVSFNKNKMSLGPVGGTGGHGGSVYIEAVSDLGALRAYRFQKEFFAEDGEKGKGQCNDGAHGKDLILKVPVGTVIHNEGANTKEELMSVGNRVRVARGGKGGKGNFHFRSSTNTSPTQFEGGMMGEVWKVRLELKLIADVGFVGLPNVGKSSLLNTLTRAKSKVGNYLFTTLEPYLGAYYELIIADIPGLIEGASSGRGLGIKFLRHIERTKIIFHLIDAESEDPLKDYSVIRGELGAYNPELLNKKEYVVLTKIDAMDSEMWKKKTEKLEGTGKKVYPISIYDEKSLKEIRVLLNDLKDKKIRGEL